MNDNASIQINIKGVPRYQCRTWSQAFVYVVTCMLRQHWPFNRRRKEVDRMDMILHYRYKRHGD